MNTLLDGHQTLSERGRKNLVNAMRGESFEYAKYKLFAEHARNNGRPDLAALFDETADQNFFDHFGRLAQALGLVGSDEQDVNHAIASEAFEAHTEYKSYIDEAREENDHALVQLFEQIRHDHAIDQLAFEQALIKLQTHERILKSAVKANSKAHIR